MADDALGVQLGQVCSLDDQTRRRLYDFVVAQPVPVSRDEISSALDIDRSLAAYHLDKLVDVGLLTASFARRDGRSGPGAGRPAKHYARAATEVLSACPPATTGCSASCSPEPCVPTATARCAQRSKPSRPGSAASWEPMRPAI